VQKMIYKKYDASKQHVAKVQPILLSHMEDLASGEMWLGYDVLDLSLVDHIMMSNEYIGKWISNVLVF